METAPRTRELAIGDCLGGCRIIQKIGRGGMGSVYEAHQISLDRKVAVKVLLLGGKTQSLLIREARLSARLNHPNIVQIYDVGRERGIDFMVMEYVEGVSLLDLLFKKPLFPIDRLRNIAIKVGRGLAAAHREKIVHRDIKPENILLTTRGEVKIADFGAAACFSYDEAADEAILGTPAYAAPEAILGQHVDGKADIYGLGLILYMAIAGAHPFPFKDKMDVLRAQIERMPEPVASHRPEINADLAAFVHRLCAKKPEDRPTAEDLVDTLEAHPEWRRTPQSTGGEEPSLDSPGRSPASGVAEGTAVPSGSTSSGRSDAGSASLGVEPLIRRKSLLDIPLVRERRASAASPAPPPGPARVPEMAPTSRLEATKTEILSGFTSEPATRIPLGTRNAAAEPTPPEADELVRDASGLEPPSAKTTEIIVVKAEALRARPPPPVAEEPESRPEPVLSGVAKARGFAEAGLRRQAAPERPASPVIERGPPRPPGLGKAPGTPEVLTTADDPPAPETPAIEGIDAPPAAAGEVDASTSVGDLCRQGRFLILRKRRSEAEGCFRQALAIDPASSMALLGLARALAEDGRAQEAVPIVVRAVERGIVAPQELIDLPYFQALKEAKEIRRLLAEHAL